METSSLTLVLTLEALAVAIVAIVVLGLQNHKMRALAQKLQARMHELVDDLKKARSEPKAPPPKPENYVHFVNQQIELTKKHHFALRGGQDIALDIDPEVPLPRRTAALRHAMLIAEKEANSQLIDKVNWDLLAARYQQLLDFNKDYDTPANANNDELESLREELNTTRKRVTNLEKFKSLYFDLEKNWRESKGKATEYYNEMTSLISEGRPSEDFTGLLENYHAAYTGFNEQIEAGINTGNMQYDEKTHQEIVRLRNVTVDQHRIINDLQYKLSNAVTEEQRTTVIKDLQTELQKQARYLQESETCIKLMEDELKNANKELDQLRTRSNQVAQVRTKMKEMQTSLESNERIIQSLKQDNRRLNQKIKTMSEAAPEDNGEARNLRRELTSLKTKYAELEERYLDLKLQG